MNGNAWDKPKEGGDGRIRTDGGAAGGGGADRGCGGWGMRAEVLKMACLVVSKRNHEMLGATSFRFGRGAIGLVRG